MSTWTSYIKGDRVLWLLALALALVGTLTVYSASSGLAYGSGRLGTLGMITKHLLLLGPGLAIMFFVSRFDYRYFGSLAKIMLLPVLALLAFTLVAGVNVSNASRWINIPGTSLTFQPSALATIVLVAYLARYLALRSAEELRRWPHQLALILPIALTCALILPANFSTAAIVFGLSLALLFFGGFPLRTLMLLILGAVAAFVLYVVFALSVPGFGGRVETWKNRIVNYESGAREDNYQVNKAKMAIAEGYLTGKGPGKSAIKNFLPQSNSDFIFAVIVEEYGSAGGLFIIALYLILLFRFLVIANKAPTAFGSLLSLGLGAYILLQAFVNLSVAVNLIPVTGQTLPLISAGGSSVWMTCLALGMILSVSRGKVDGHFSAEEEVSASPAPDAQPDATDPVQKLAP